MMEFYKLFLLNIFIHSIVAFLQEHKDYVAIDPETITKFTIPENTRCECGRDNLNDMALVEFKSGQKYLVSAEPLGKGGQAKVYHAIHIGIRWRWFGPDMHSCRAIKKTNKVEVAKNEGEILKNLWNAADKPKHIIRFYGNEFYQIRRRELGVIVMELAKDNFNHYWRQQMEKYGKLKTLNVDEKLILLMVRQMAIALSEVHERDYLFIDFNGANILVTGDTPELLTLKNAHELNLKLTDFGAAVPKWLNLPIEMKLNTFTPFYAPNEIKMEESEIKKVSPKTDVFSLGRVTLELVLQTPYFAEYVEAKNYRKLFHVEGFTLSSSMLIKQIISTMLCEVIGNFCERPINNEGYTKGEKQMLINLYALMKRKYPAIMDLIEETEKELVDRPNMKELINLINTAIISESGKPSERNSGLFTRSFSVVPRIPTFSGGCINCVSTMIIDGNLLERVPKNPSKKVDKKEIRKIVDSIRHRQNATPTAFGRSASSSSRLFSVLTPTLGNN